MKKLFGGKPGFYGLIMASMAVLIVGQLMRLGDGGAELNVVILVSCAVLFVIAAVGLVYSLRLRRSRPRPDPRRDPRRA